MFEDETRVLMILPRELVDRTRVLAGRSTTTMKLPVSLQIVVRALIEEGLKRPGDSALLANIGRRAVTVRRNRAEGRRRAAALGARIGRATRARPAGSPRRSA
jgi:hypothetical protein